MPDYDLNNYELTDKERPGLTFEKFDKDVKRQYKKEENHEIKPHKIFEGYKKEKKGKK